MEDFPKLSRRKYPSVLSIKVDLDTRNIYSYLKERGYDAAEIFRVNGRTGLEAAKKHIIEHGEEDDRSA